MGILSNYTTLSHLQQLIHSSVVYRSPPLVWSQYVIYKLKKPFFRLIIIPCWSSAKLMDFFCIPHLWIFFFIQKVFTALLNSHVRVPMLVLTSDFSFGAHQVKMLVVYMWARWEHTESCYRSHLFNIILPFMSPGRSAEL